MPRESRDDERIHPRSFLRDEAEFGRNHDAQWKPLTDDVDVAQLIGAYWQHLVVCTFRAKFPVMTAETLARSLGTTNVVYLRRQLNGEYRVPIEVLCLWAATVEDVSVLPQFDTASDLYPPGSRPAPEGTTTRAGGSGEDA